MRKTRTVSFAVRVFFDAPARAFALFLVAAAFGARASARTLYECRGPVAAKETGWRFQASAAGGGFAFNPLEGWYPDKGGKLVSPRIAVPRTNAHYRLAFTAFAPQRAYEAVAFYDAGGKMVSDNYDVVYPATTGRYERVIFAQEGIASLEVFFQSTAGCFAADLTVEECSDEEAAAWCDRVAARLPPVEVERRGDAFLSARRTREALETGRPVRILLLGDSIVQDTFHSQFQSLVKRAYPKSRATWLVSVRGSTGCWYYRLPGNFERCVAAYRPDCVIVGGISNWAAPTREYPVSGNAALVDVCEKIQAIGADLIVVSPTLSVDTRLKAGTKESTPVPARVFDDAAAAEALALTRNDGSSAASGLSPEAFAQLRQTCAERGWGLIDAFTPAYKWLYESALPLSWYSRDSVHSGELGKQAIARIMIANLCAGE